MNKHRAFIATATDANAYLAVLVVFARDRPGLQVAIGEYRTGGDRASSLIGIAEEFKNAELCVARYEPRGSCAPK